MFFCCASTFSKIYSRKMILYLILLFCKYETVESNINLLLYNTPNSMRFTDLMDISVQMIDICFANKSLVIPVESTKFQSDEFIRTIYPRNKNDLIFIDNKTDTNQFNLKTTESIFVVSANSENNSMGLLKALKQSPYWNHLGLFIFIDINVYDLNGVINCNNAKVILKSAWHMNIQSSLFICIDDNKTPMIFTSNPFTKRAPAPWKHIASQSEEYWTLYSQRYHEGLLCNTLNYKRDEALDDYPVRFVRFNLLDDGKTFKRDFDYSIEKFQSLKLNIFDSFSLNFVSALSKTLNVSSSIAIEQQMSHSLYSDYKRLDNQLADVTFYTRDFNIPKNTSYLSSSPLSYESYCIFSRKQGYFSPLEKIWNFFGIITIISMSIVLTMTFLVILKIKKHSVSFAGFEILRLIINSSLLVRMETISIRIFFAVVFLYFLIFQALFQGNLSKFLTKPSTKPNINSLKDLSNPNIHKVYVSSTLYKTDEFAKEIKPFNHKVSYIKPEICIKLVIENKHAACIGYPILQVTMPANEDIHITRGIFSFRVVYNARNDWPLIKRLDSSILELHESGLADYYFETIFSKSHFDERKKEALLKVDPRAISMSDIFFAFVILFIGLSLSFIVFLSEINSNYKSTKNRKRKIATKNRHV